MSGEDLLKKTCLAGPGIFSMNPGLSWRVHGGQYRLVILYKSAQLNQPACFHSSAYSVTQMEK